MATPNPLEPVKGAGTTLWVYNGKGEVQGVFDDPESLGFAGGGVRIEGSSPSLFVRTDTVRAVRRGDTLTINGEMFWVDRVSPDDGGSCYLWLNRGQPPAVNRRR